MGYLGPMILLGTFHWCLCTFQWSSCLAGHVCRGSHTLLALSRGGRCPTTDPFGGERSVPLEQGVRRARPTAHTAAIAGFVLVSGHGT